MRPLLFFILFISYCSLATYANTSNTHSTKKLDLGAPPKSSNLKTKTKNQDKSFVKSIFASSIKKESTEKSKTTTPSKKNIIKIDQLKEIIDSLPEQDKKTLVTIRKQISTWPKEVFDEISDYREFIINSRNIAQQKYELLSQEAKKALETERHLKSKLSQSTIKTLENLEVDIS
ncbi:MAG: hypothetical protein HRU36_02350 [Rickettsiales bacterium]|nr:hypothetical protein [Rickettsiales bacterium]